MSAEYIARSTKVAARRVGDELMIMSGRDSTLFSLNATAALIWDAADGSTRLQEIVEREICTQFDVEPATALLDARQLVDDLARHGILIVSDVPVSM
jgi:hypothetical protein